MNTYCTVHVIAVNKEGEFLILQRADHRSDPGSWNCITGYIEERESGEDAALRELKEETNLEGVIVKTGDPHWSEHDEKRFVIIPVLVEVSNEEDMKIDAHESSAFDWVDSNDKRVIEKGSLMESLKKVDYQTKL